MQEISSMKDIVDNKDYLPDSESVNTTRNQMKLFILAQARSQLSKVLELNTKLDKWIDKYTEKADERMSSEDVTPEEISVYMKQIMELIDRSNSMIKSVIGDEKLINLMYLDMSNNVTNNNGGSVITTSEIDSSPVSRNKIRTAVSSIIGAIDSYTDSSNEEIVEEVDNSNN